MVTLRHHDGDSPATSTCTSVADTYRYECAGRGALAVGSGNATLDTRPLESYATRVRVVSSSLREPAATMSEASGSRNFQSRPLASYAKSVTSLPGFSILA